MPDRVKARPEASAHAESDCGCVSAGPVDPVLCAGAGCTELVRLNPWEAQTSTGSLGRAPKAGGTKGASKGSSTTCATAGQCGHGPSLQSGCVTDRSHNASNVTPAHESDLGDEQGWEVRGIVVKELGVKGKGLFGGCSRRAGRLGAYGGCAVGKMKG